MRVAQKKWNRLNGARLIAAVIDGGPVVDGLRQEAASANLLYNV